MTIAADNIRGCAGKTIRYFLLEADARGVEFFTIATQGKPLLGGVAWRALVLCNPGGTRGGRGGVCRALSAIWMACQQRLLAGRG